MAKYQKWIDTLSPMERENFLKKLEDDRLQKLERQCVEVEQEINECGIQYGIWLKDKKKEQVWFEDTILPGVIISSRGLSLMLVSFVRDYLHICDDYDCPMACSCHIGIVAGKKSNTYRGFCTVLFHDAVKPRWKLQDVI